MDINISFLKCCKLNLVMLKMYVWMTNLDFLLFYCLTYHFFMHDEELRPCEDSSPIMSLLEDKHLPTKWVGDFIICELIFLAKCVWLAGESTGKWTCFLKYLSLKLFSNTNMVWCFLSFYPEWNVWELHVGPQHCEDLFNFPS